MALNIPTTQEIKEQNVANLETQIGQSAPINDKAFLRVLSAIEALMHTGLYKYAAERGKQNLAISATGSDLDRIGNEYEVIRKAAEATVLTITLPGTNGTVIPATVFFTGDLNGIRYYPDSSATVAAGVATMTVTAEEPGVIGNLQVSDTLSINTQIAGAESTATVTVIDNTGADEETDEAYRERVLFVIRSTFGGSNAADHKAWAEEVAGVRRAYPYSGQPVDDPPPTSYPGDRTIYVEATVAINADGIAPQSLLDEVRESINYDPDTGESRPALGLIDDTLWVESIIRTTFNVTIRGLDVDPTDEGAAKDDIDDALDAYLRGITPFVDGIDLSQDRNDLITDLTVSAIVQDVLNTYGGSAVEVDFALPDTIPLDDYRLEQGELAKLGTVTYVA
jgi:hypothetical protein